MAVFGAAVFGAAVFGAAGDWADARDAAVRKMLSATITIGVVRVELMPHHRMLR
jgi:hypothetical protein